jgi:hypothetical protein
MTVAPGSNQHTWAEKDIFLMFLLSGVETVDGLRSSSLAQVRWCEPGAPVWSRFDINYGFLLSDSPADRRTTSWPAISTVAQDAPNTSPSAWTAIAGWYTRLAIGLQTTRSTSR